MSIKRKRFLVLFALVIGVASSSIAFVSARRAASLEKQPKVEGTTSKESISLASAPIAPQAKHAIAQIEAEIVTVTPHGFEPLEITRPQGSFLLMIDNRSGLAISHPQLGRAAGERLRDITVPREDPNWSEVVDLPPGRYLLGEAGHPGWTCQITITPR